MVRKIKEVTLNFFRFYPVFRNAKEASTFLRKKSSTGSFTVKVFRKTIIKLRGAGSTDAHVFASTFLDKHHRSPFHLGEAPVIVDLGSNIGLTLLDYHYQYPNARLIGVEMDRENFSLLQFNTSTIKNCESVNAAIWKRDGEINYGGSDSQSFQVTQEATGNNGNTVPALSIDTLMSRYQLAQVDFLKMDIEGAEEQIFLESDFMKWAANVKIISMEVHGTNNYTTEALTDKLTSLLTANGFLVFKSALHWSSLIAVNSLRQ